MKNMVKGLEIKHLDIFADNAIKMIKPFIQVILKTDGVLFIIIVGSVEIIIIFLE